MQKPIKKDNISQTIQIKKTDFSTQTSIEEETNGWLHVLRSFSPTFKLPR